MNNNLIHKKNWNFLILKFICTSQYANKFSKLRFLKRIIILFRENNYLNKYINALNVNIFKKNKFNFFLNKISCKGDNYFIIDCLEEKSLFTILILIQNITYYLSKCRHLFIEEDLYLFHFLKKNEINITAIYIVFNFNCFYFFSKSNILNIPKLSVKETNIKYYINSNIYVILLKINENLIKIINTIKFKLILFILNTKIKFNKIS